jgi:CRISPR-associated protein Csm3
LFGSTVAASKIRITDLKLLNGGKTAIRDGVAIDRDTETAKEGAKFDFETVSKESRFAFEIIGENLTKLDLGLLAIGIQELVDGNFWLGGNSARGLGRCKLEGLSISHFEGKNGLKNYLITKKLSPMDKDAFLGNAKTLLGKEA